MREAVKDPEDLARMEAQRDFARSPERLPAFPPAPREVPEWRGWLLEDWIKPAPTIDNIETIEVTARPVEQ